MAGNLTKEEVAQFKEAFALFDSNKDGKLEPDELKFVMSALGQECTEEEIKGDTYIYPHGKNSLIMYTYLQILLLWPMNMELE